MSSDIHKNLWKHLTPIEAQKRLRVLDTLRVLEDLDVSTLDYLAATEILDLLKVATNLAVLFFDQESQSSPAVNPEVQGGETITQPDATTKSQMAHRAAGEYSVMQNAKPNPLLGTVKSRSRRARGGGLINSPNPRSSFLALYGVLQDLETKLKSEQIGLFDQTCQDFAVLLEALRTKHLNPDALTSIWVRDREGAQVAPEALSSARNAKIKDLRRFGYRIRKSQTTRGKRSSINHKPKA